MSLIRKITPLLAPQRVAILALVLSSAVLVAAEGLGLGSLLLLAGPVQVGSMLPGVAWLDPLAEVARKAPFATRVQWAVIVLLCVMLVRTSMSFSQQSIALRLRIATMRTIQRKLLADLHRVPLSYFQAEPSGSWHSFLVQNSREIGFLVETAALAVVGVLTTLAYLLLAFTLSWQFTLLAMAPLAAIMMALRPLVRTRLQRAHLRMQMRLRELGGVAQEQLSATRAVRIFGRQAWSQARFGHAQNAFLREDTRVGTLMAMSRPLFELFGAVGIALIVLAGSMILPGSNEERLAQIVLFLAIALRLLGPVAQISYFLAQYAKASSIVAGVFAFHDDVDRLALPNGSTPIAALRDGIEFRGVGFSYGVGHPEALEAVSLHIARGRTTAIVGASGAGKSSLVNLLARLYDPVRGAIYVDGIDLKELEIGSWREHLAVVSQEILVFHSSVWDNLRFARPDASDAEIVRACTLAQAHEFISVMPDGYDTILQEHGTRLSGGQRQRISLARALLADAEVLVLDEATSELDYLTERAVQQALTQCRSGRTLLVIAHRLSAVSSADTIYVLEAGRVVEQGSHLQLLDERGAYSQLARAHAQN